MKHIYNIQYQLVDDAILRERIKSLGYNISYFKNNWLVVSSLTAKEIYNKISQDYEKTSIIITEISEKNYWGVMSSEIWEWLRLQGKGLDNS